MREEQRSRLWRFLLEQKIGGATLEDVLGEVRQVFREEQPAPRPIMTYSAWKERREAAKAAGGGASFVTTDVEGKPVAPISHSGWAAAAAQKEGLPMFEQIRAGNVKSYADWKRIKGELNGPEEAA